MSAYDPAKKFGMPEGMRISLCVRCKHKQAGRTCAAFPDGIPRDFLDGTREHRRPEPGDQGIQFEPAF